MMNKIALFLLFFSLSVIPEDQQVLQKQLINAIRRLDVEAVSRLAHKGTFEHVNMAEIFKDIRIVERQLQKALSLKAAVKMAIGLVCIAVSGRFIYKSYMLNEDSQESVADLFWRLLYGYPGKKLDQGTTNHVFNLPLTAFAGSLFTVGSYWALGGYEALYKKALDSVMQQKLTVIVHILMNANKRINKNLVV